MKKVFFAVFCLLFASIIIPAYASEFGSIKIIPPTEDCEIFVDGIQVGSGTVTTKIAEGKHNVVVNLKDGTPLYNDQAEVIANEVATVSVSYELKKKNMTKITPPVKVKPQEDNIESNEESGSNKFKKASEINKNIIEKRKGEGFGFSIGVDNTNYKISASGASDTLDLGNQFDISAQYAKALSPSTYVELGISLLRTAGSFKNGLGTTTNVFTFPLSASIKTPLSKDTFVGGGLNYSLWMLTTGGAKIVDVTPSFGYQVFFELTSLSSEIGYIVKNGTFSSSGTTYDLSSSGAYYKFKYYF